MYGDEFKQAEDNRRLETGHPIIARLDGKNFHSWTRGLSRPYDEGLSLLMAETTKYLVDETNALLGYTQSDEISLTWNPTGDTEAIFGGKVQKIVSILASMCTSYFNDGKDALPPKQFNTNGLFDCRVFTVYSEGDAAGYFHWRQWDAKKNAISMAAQEYFSPNKLHGIGGEEKIAMLAGMGIQFDEYPEFFRLGTFFKRRVVARTFTETEITKLPPKHQAHANPSLMVERSESFQESAPEKLSDWRDWIYF